jgi:putative peptide zinc metalloprotease protein
MREPKLRDGLIIRKVAEGDDVAYTVCDLPRNQYFRIDPVTHLVAAQLDGRTSLAEVARICQERMPYTDLSLSVVEEAVQDLDAIGILENPYQKNILLLERARARRPRVAEFFRNMLLWQVGMWDPDAFLERTHKWVAWLFEPLPALLWTVAFALSGLLVYLERDRLDFDVMRLMGFDGSGGAGVFWFWVIFIVIGFLHESGHAHACKHFGGRVHRMGAMLMYFSPCFFVDVSTSMLFENRWHRIWVAMGGIYVEVIITALATLVWYVTPTGLLLNDVAYRVMIVGFIIGVLVNLNPLIKLDGYYVVSDLLQISELRERSMAYWKDLLRKYALRKPMLEPVHGIRRRRAYGIYGGIAIAYTAFILFAFFAWLHDTLVASMAETGFLLSMAAVGMMLRRPVGNLVARVRAGGLPSRWHALPAAAAVLALLLFLGGVIRTPATVTANARVAGGWHEVVRAREPGLVLSMLVEEGDRVLPRQVVALVSNDSLEASWRRVRAVGEEAAQTLARAIESHDPATYDAALREHGAAHADEVGLRRATTGLALSVQRGGTVLTPRLQDWIGSYVEAGDTLLEVESADSVQLLCTVSEHDVGLIEPGQRFEARLRVDPGRRLAGRVLRVDPGPRAEPGMPQRYRVICAPDGAPADARLGSTGRVRIEVGQWNVYDRLVRFWARVVRADFWI